MRADEIQHSPQAARVERITSYVASGRAPENVMDKAIERAMEAANQAFHLVLTDDEPEEMQLARAACSRLEHEPYDGFVLKQSVWRVDATQATGIIKQSGLKPFTTSIRHEGHWFHFNIFLDDVQLTREQCIAMYCIELEYCE